jgi:hypothetical protein
MIYSRVKHIANEDYYYKKGEDLDPNLGFDGKPAEQKLCLYMFFPHLAVGYASINYPYQYHCIDFDNPQYWPVEQEPASNVQDDGARHYYQSTGSDPNKREERTLHDPTDFANETVS